MKPDVEQLLKWLADELPALKARLDSTRAAIERARRTLGRR